MNNAIMISTLVRVTLLLWIAFHASPPSSPSSPSSPSQKRSPPSKGKQVTRYMQSSGLKSILSNPTHTLSHMREGVFLSKILPSGSFITHPSNRTYAHIYASSSSSSSRSAFFHAPPLLLALVDPLILEWIPSEKMQDLVFGLLMVLVDLCTAVGLLRLARNVLAEESEERVACAVEGDGGCRDKMMEWEMGLERRMDPSIRPDRAWIFGLLFPPIDATKNTDTDALVKKASTDTGMDEREPILPLSEIPQTCAVLYYCNPISILANTCGACSFHSLFHLLLVSSLQELTAVAKPIRRRSENDVPLAMLYLAIVCHVEMSNVVFLLPAVLFTNRRLGYGKVKRATVGCVGNFLLWSLLLQYLSLILVGKSTFFSMLRQSHAKEYNFVDLDVNIGMLWYYFVNTFERFRRYFAVMHFGMVYMFVAPLALRFHRYPMAITAMLSTLLCLFKPIPTLNDTILSFTLLLLSPRTLARTTQKSIVSLAALPVPIALYVIDYWTWLETGGGNANYVFFQCLAFNVFVAVIFQDFLTATLRREKALRLTEKGPKKVVVDGGKETVVE